MNGLEHPRYLRCSASRGVAKDIAVPVNNAPLPVGIRIDIRYRLNQSLK